jgi:hypothetical protein
MVRHGRNHGEVAAGPSLIGVIIKARNTFSPLLHSGITGSKSFFATPRTSTPISSPLIFSRRSP